MPSFPRKPMGMQEQSSGINYVGDATEARSEAEVLCFVRLGGKKNPDVPKWNPVAPGEVTPAVWLSSQSTRPREPGHTFCSS